MTIPQSEALRKLRAAFKAAPAVVRASLLKHGCPLHVEGVPGWAYYARTDSVEYTGHVVGGN